MIVVMGVTLYTTRVVLEVLGETNFGIYNIIGGIVLLFVFLNNALSNATQRYLSFALGKNNIELFNRYFSASINSYIILSLIIIIASETIGLWFVNTQLSIPSERMYAANIVYQLTIISFIANLFKIPFEAAVISHEHMSIYAYISMADVILRLAMVFLLLVLPGDKLVDYAMLMTLIPIGITFTFGFLCRNKLHCSYQLETDRTLHKDLFSYSTWSLVGGIANVAARQGGNILINIFFGVVVNAAFGIANQVNTAVTSLAGSFQTAFRPQIVKLYANSEKKELDKLLFRTSLWSYYLILILILPIVFNLNDILHLWLKDVPQYTNIFIILLLIYAAIDAVQTPIITNITATANIKVYEIWLSAILLLNLPVSYVLFVNGYPPFAFFIVYAVLNLVTAIIRTIYAGYFVNFPVLPYVRQVVSKIILITICSIVLSFLCHYLIPHFRFSFIVSAAMIFLIVCGVIFTLGLTTNERHIVINTIQTRLHLSHKR
jgi:O-antigen/teichoic acid export membrane protein